MTTSDRAYVWAWLPGATEPVVAGVLQQVEGGRYGFAYGRSYLARAESVSLYAPELPLRRGTQLPDVRLRIASCLRDAAPDAWGRRVVYEMLMAGIGKDSDTASLSELTYLLNSGSDRIGALDFQTSSETYQPRGTPASLDELHEAADRLDDGRELSPALERALVHGTSIGGARPKALLDDPDGGPGWIAKFSSSDDHRPVIGQEATSMYLAAQAGLRVPEVKVVTSLKKDVLLVQRFDRDGRGGRRMLVSGLTLAGEDEMTGRYVTYPQLVDAIRRRSVAPDTVGPEMFERIVFNIAVSNTDDHARNHSAFWDGEHLELTPAYDLDPQPRSGEEASQAMSFSHVPLADRRSSFDNAVDHSGHFGLSRVEATAVVERVVSSIRENFSEAADFGRLTRRQAEAMWGRQVLNPGSTRGW